MNEGNRIQCYRLRQGRVEHIAHAAHYRLFFLLEGKIFLKSQVAGKHLLYAKEMMMLPAGSEISCSAFDKSKFVILDCTVLRAKGNVSYMEELKEVAFVYEPKKMVFPICIKLEKVLNGFFGYTMDGNYYTDAYDAVFIFLRSLYTPQELGALFAPMIRVELKVES